MRDRSTSAAAGTTASYASPGRSPTSTAGSGVAVADLDEALSYRLDGWERVAA